MTNVKTSTVDGKLTIALSGELSYDTAERIQEAVSKACADTRHRALVVDLSGVTLLDSSGIGALVSLFNAEQRNGTLCLLARPTPEVMRTLELVNLDKFFRIVQNDGETELFLSEVDI